MSGHWTVRGVQVSQAQFDALAEAGAEWLNPHSHLGGQGGCGPDLRVARALVRRGLAVEVPDKDPRWPSQFRLTELGKAVAAEVQERVREANKSVVAIPIQPCGTLAHICDCDACWTKSAG